ncbi:helix-turn-helix domain-containing protein [Leucobacter sp. NPDC015123]|uniref:TetR/AcrR family transcriptional regulator n=1 Tax=Leucobacter sp. NPDC015123 TaxID=3364129 RepID=UPI0036F46817
MIIAGTIEFGLHGYAGAQTSAIAERAGVSQPNVYANFRSKRELFLACVGELCTQSAHLAEHESLDDRQALLLFQAFAAAREPALGPELRGTVRAMREELGDDRIGLALAHAASILAA